MCVVYANFSFIIKLYFIAEMKSSSSRRTRTNGWSIFLSIYARTSPLKTNRADLLQNASVAWNSLSAVKQQEYRKMRVVNARRPSARRGYVYRSKTKRLNMVLEQLRQLNEDVAHQELHPNRVTAIKSDIRQWQLHVLDLFLN